MSKGRKILVRNSPNKITKANALLCPSCCAEYIDVELDFEFENTVLKNVKALRCPCCGEEQFSPSQLEAVNKQIDKFKSRF